MKFKIRTELDKTKVVEYIRNLSDKKVFYVDIKMHRTVRTISQNRLYWLYVGIVADETGNDKDTIHQYCLQTFIGSNKHIVFGKEVFTSPTTTELNTKQFTDYVEQVRAWAQTELGINLPDPDSIYLEELLEKYL